MNPEQHSLKDNMMERRDGVLINEPKQAARFEKSDLPQDAVSLPNGFNLKFQ